MKCLLTIITILVSAFFRISSCANVLIVSLLASPSHHIWNEALAEGLVKIGHNVTLLGHDKPRFTSENYTVLKIEGVYEALATSSLAAFQELSDLKKIAAFWDFNKFTCELDLKSDALKFLLTHPRETFQIILFDINAGYCTYPLIEAFGNPPVIAISAFGLSAFTGDIMGHHIFPYVPFYMLPDTDRMSFFRRLRSQFYHVADVFARRYSHLPITFSMAQDVFGQDITDFEQVERRITLAIYNIEPLLNYPQPLPPNVISVGGLHVKPSKKLPDDLQAIMDNATNGIVYFSLGTNIQPQHIPPEQRRNLMNAFGRLPFTILAKFNDDDLAIPKNVILRRWLPQNDILSHANLRVFLTHGGALSTQEALYHGAPVVGIPLFADQRSNMFKIVNKKLGLTVDFFGFTEQDIFDALTEVANNPMYRNNMRELSRKFRDQPQTPLDRAVFWVEYVLRNGNADHLSIAARDMYSYQTLHLDIFAFIIFTLILIVYFSSKAIKFAWRLLRKKTAQKKIKRQ